MDWTPAVAAAQADHDARCDDLTDPGHDWRYCAVTVPVPEHARRLGLIEEARPTLAERDAAVPVVTDRPDLDAVWCVCGQKRRGHSVDGSRCYHCAECTGAGGFRDRDQPDTWGTAQRRTMSLNPEATGQAFGEAVDRPDWFRHGD